MHAPGAGLIGKSWLALACSGLRMIGGPSVTFPEQIMSAT
jgi:hypothetical protein